MPGLTVTSENPVYIQGDYNAAGGFGDPHSAAAVIADGVTLLSNAWSDLNGINWPLNPNQRNATDTWYRAAIGTGTTLNFPQPTGTPSNFGTDGGVPNLLRFLESWSGDDLWYRGSLGILSRAARPTARSSAVTTSIARRHGTSNTTPTSSISACCHQRRRF